MIETQIWNKIPEQPGKVEYAGQRKIGEVFKDLCDFLKAENIYPEEYFLLNSRLNEEDDFPECDVECYAQWGGNEGIYLEVILAIYNRETGAKRISFATGKTLDETGAAYDRMQYIAGRIYKAFCGEGFIPARYMIIPDQKKEITYNRLISKLEEECTSFMRTELLHKKTGLAEVSRKLGMMLTVLSIIKEPGNYADLTADKVEELYCAENILERICGMCNRISEADDFEIADIIASAPSLLQESAEQTVEKSEPKENLYYGFTHFSRMSYKDAMPSDVEDMITFGLYVRNDGCISEASVCWSNLDGKLCPYFRIFDDGIKAAFSARFLAVVDKLRNAGNFTPNQMAEVLISQGFEDRSDEPLKIDHKASSVLPESQNHDKPTKFQERIDALKAKADKRGAHFEYNLFDKDHLECFWYDGKDYITIEYQGYSICFDVCGDVYATLVCDESVNEEGFVELCHKNGAEPIYFNKEVSQILQNDHDLIMHRLAHSADFESGNWVNIIVTDITAGVHVSEPEASEDSNLLDAAENAFDAYIDYIDKLKEETE